MSRAVARLGSILLFCLFALVAPTVAQAACQQTADFTANVLNDPVTIDVSSCSEGLRAGLYDANGFDSQIGFPISSVPNNGPPQPKTFSVSGGATSVLTPVSNDFEQTYFQYTVKLAQLCSSATASLPLWYASQSCPVLGWGIG